MAALRSTLICVCIVVEIYSKKMEDIEEPGLQKHRHKRGTVEYIEPPEILTEKYRNLAMSGLLNESYSFDKSPMTRLSMSCKCESYKTIMKAFPLAEIRWKHNGENLILQPSRMITTLDSLTIQNLVPKDSGVYNCHLGLGDDIESSDKNDLVVKVYSVVVGSLNKHVHSGEDLQIKCNAKELGLFFKSANRVWYNPVDKKTISKPVNEPTEDIISSADNKAAGSWTCFVENPATNQTWKTARINVVLEPPLSDWDKIKRYAKNNKPVVFVVLFAATFVIVLIIDGITKLLEWKQRKFKKELNEVQTILGLDPMGDGPEGIPLMIDEHEISEKSNAGSDSESELRA